MISTVDGTKGVMRIRLTLATVAVAAVCVAGVALAAVSLSVFTARPGDETGFSP